MRRDLELRAVPRPPRVRVRHREDPRLRDADREREQPDPARVVGNVAALDALTYTVLPFDYATVSFRSAVVGDHELVALHDAEDALWVWRPLIYTLHAAGIVQRHGSQGELEWRWGLAEAKRRTLEIDGDRGDFLVAQIEKVRKQYGCLPIIDRQPGQTGFRLPKNARKRLFREYREFVDGIDRGEFEFVKAREKAEAILIEHLAPQQRIDYLAWNRFYVRGTINRLYVVRVGDGAAIVSPYNGETWVSMCIHPERWMPHADIALATKLLIESGPDGEEELLAGCRPTVFGQRPATREQRYAWDGMRALLPPPLAEVTLP